MSRSSATTRSSWPRRSPPTAATPPASWWPPRAGTPAAAPTGSPTARGATRGRGAGGRGRGAAGGRRARAPAPALGLDAIGLYQFHRPDPATPWEESMGALRQLVDDGLVQRAGVSNAGVAQIDVARSIVGPALVSVQNQFSPGWRYSADELAHCAGHGAAVLPWSPLGGVSAAGSLGSAAPAFAEVAQELDVSVYRVTLAWHLAPSEVVVPIPGAAPPPSTPAPP